MYKTCGFTAVRASVGAQTYTYDNNGNLLSDGVSAYTYDTANRLTTVSQGADTYSFAYNGLGDRLQQTVNAVTTNYTLDLNAGLTQVLSDGTNSYLYGLGRIGEFGAAWSYHMPDALGSVRQQTDNAGNVTMAQTYEPFGDVLESMFTRECRITIPISRCNPGATGVDSASQNRFFGQDSPLKVE
jgi:YD repeat-containing protein